MIRYGLDLKEQRNVRVAIRHLRSRVGGNRALATLLERQPDTVEKIASGKRPVSLQTALRVARVAKTTIEDLISGRWPGGFTCPHCGRTPDFSDEETKIDVFEDAWKNDADLGR